MTLRIKSMVSILSISGMLLAGCSGQSGVSAEEACRVLKLASGLAMDYSLQTLGRQDPDNLHEFLPPSPETIKKIEATKLSLTELTVKLDGDDKAALASRFAQDLEAQLSAFTPEAPLSSEANAAVVDDIMQVRTMCGY